MLGATMAVLMFVRALMTTVRLLKSVRVAVTIFSIGSGRYGRIDPAERLHRLRVDPAVVSAPFISGLVDTTGLMIYFAVAQAVLGLS